MPTPTRISAFLAALAALLLATACDRRATEPASSSPATAAADPYDVKKMDLKPPPAVVSQERHTGAFAQGAALSMEAAVKPLDASPVKEVRLDTTHKVIEIAPGVKFSA